MRIRDLASTRTTSQYATLPFGRAPSPSDATLHHDILRFELDVEGRGRFEWWRHRRTSSPEADDNDDDGRPDRDILGQDVREI